MSLNGSGTNNVIDIGRYLVRPNLADGLNREELAALLEQLKALEGRVMARLLLGATDQPVVTRAPADVRLLTAKQVAECLEVKESWVMSEARADRIPKHMVGRYVRFDLGEVRRALEQRQP